MEDTTGCHDDGGSLNEEIAALRHALRRVMAEAAATDDMIRSAGTIARLSEALVKAVRADRALRGCQDDRIQDAFDQVLAEMGLGLE